MSEIMFFYKNDSGISFEQKEDAQKFFIEKLGTFKQEFEDKNGSVTIDFGEPETSKRRYEFNVGKEYSLYDFIFRWNNYIKGLREDQLQ